LEVAGLTRAAFDALVTGDHTTALSLYRDVLEIRPDDPVAKLHAERLDAKEDLSGAEVRMLERGDG